MSCKPKIEHAIEKLLQYNAEAAMLTSAQARLAQSAERKALNLVVVGSSPTVGALVS